MNKFGVAFALIVGLVGLVSAHKIRPVLLEEEHELHRLGHARHGFRHGGIHRGGLRGHSGFEGGHLGHLDEELLLEELPRGHRYGHRHGGFGGSLGRSGRIGRRSQLGGIGGGHLGRSRLGLGAVGGVGGAGFRDSESEFGDLNAGSNAFESGLAEKERAGLLAGQKEFDVGQHFKTNNENEGLHKHQVINSDKTIIKDKTFGVNDVDSFKSSNGVSQGSHAGGSESGIAAGLSSGKVAGERESDHHINAVGGERAEATGVAGAAF